MQFDDARDEDDEGDDEGGAGAEEASGAELDAPAADAPAPAPASAAQAERALVAAPRRGRLRRREERIGARAVGGGLATAAERRWLLARDEMAE